RVAARNLQGVRFFLPATWPLGGPVFLPITREEHGASHCRAEDVRDLGRWSMSGSKVRLGWRVAGTVLCVAAAVAVSGVASAQGTSRPQLVVERAEADLTTDTLLIEGRKLLWNNDSAVVVTLAETPLLVLSGTETEVLAQLPPGLAPGSYLLKVSRGQSTVQNDVFDVTI